MVHQMKKLSGYTLIELIAVSALSLLLLSVSVAGYHTWTKSTAMDNSVTCLKAQLTRARTYALTRSCPTRIRLSSGAKDSVIDIEHRETDDVNSWYQIAPSKHINAKSKAQIELYFRNDGSCCLTEDELESDIAHESYTIALDSIDGNTAFSKNIIIDSSTGLYAEKETVVK